MDNLRSLNSSLPTPTSSRRQRAANSRPAPQPSQQALLQAFKTAALSVTNLYRTAAADASASSYSDGYRDALEDLVDFLDSEDLGLGDGEGWMVRQYLAEKLAQTPPAAAGQQNNTAEGSEDEAADAEDEEKRARSDSPIAQAKTDIQQRQQQQQHGRSPTPPTARSTPPAQVDQSHTQFTFQAGQSYPAPSSVQDTEMDGSSQLQSTHRSTPRTRHGTLRLNGQSHNRAAVALAGSKRKMPLVDFFDITDFSGGRDGTSGGAGGGKRNRLI